VRWRAKQLFKHFYIGQVVGKQIKDKRGGKDNSLPFCERHQRDMKRWYVSSYSSCIQASIGFGATGT
jgi:hypothetical protein